MSVASLRLPLTTEERAALRRASLRVSELASMSPNAVEMVTKGDIAYERAELLTGLASLQTLPNVGPDSAEMLYESGFRRPHDLRGVSADDLFVRLAKDHGVDHPIYWDFAAAVCYCVNDDAAEGELCWIPAWSARRRQEGFDPKTLLGK